MSKPKVIAIVGPTASGKSDLAVELALRFDGEVVSADSRQVYRELDLGSGKITPKEMQGVPHHLLDVADPKTDSYTGSDFTKDANVAIKEILERGKVPIVAGGTFFWLELLRGRKAAAPVPPNPTLRAKLEKFSTEELFTQLKQKDKQRASNIDQHNRQRLIRSLEIIDSLGKVPKTAPEPSPFDWLIIGIDIDKETLHQRIELRLEKRLKMGMVTEVQELISQGVPAEKLISFGLEYRYITEYLQGQLAEEQMKELIITKSLQFAKRQYTWLKTDQSIVWKKFPVDIDKLEAEVRTFLDSQIRK